jgi:hypothetical protein
MPKLGSSTWEQGLRPVGETLSERRLGELLGEVRDRIQAIVGSTRDRMDALLKSVPAVSSGWIRIPRCGRSSKLRSISSAPATVRSASSATTEISASSSVSESTLSASGPVNCVPGLGRHDEFGNRPGRRTDGDRGSKGAAARRLVEIVVRALAGAAGIAIDNSRLYDTARR